MSILSSVAVKIVSYQNLAQLSLEQVTMVTPKKVSFIPKCKLVDGAAKGSLRLRLLILPKGTFNVYTELSSDPLHHKFSTYSQTSQEFLGITGFDSSSTAPNNQFSYELFDQNQINIESRS